jgi:hypothetical protein
MDTCNDVTIMTIYQPWKRVRTRRGSVTVQSKGWILQGRDCQAGGKCVRRWFPTLEAAQQYAAKRHWITNK